MSDELTTSSESADVKDQSDISAVDEQGVPWLNRAKELERKLKEAQELQQKYEQLLQSYASAQQASVPAAKPTESDEPTEEELAELAKTAPLPVMKYVLEKKKHEWRNEFLKEVEQKQTYTQRFTAAREKALSNPKYKDLKDPNSALFKKTQEIYAQKMQDPVYANNPDLPLIAVREAFDEVGGNTMSFDEQVSHAFRVYDHNVEFGGNPAPSPSVSPSEPKLTEEELYIARKLGVDPKKYAARKAHVKLFVSPEVKRG